MTAVPDFRCDEVIVIGDDRWGAMRSRCEGNCGHDDWHFIAYDACEPPAFLMWRTPENTDDGDV
jgi:hypothetical protein